MKHGKQIKINVNLGQSRKMASVVRNTVKIQGINVILPELCYIKLGRETGRFSVQRMRIVVGVKLKYYSQVVKACTYTYTKARLQIRTATSVPGCHLSSDRTLENLVWHEEEIEEWRSLLSDLAALSKPWHLRNEVCSWVLQVGRCKTLPPDTATFPPQGAREVNRGFDITPKSLPRII